MVRLPHHRFPQGAVPQQRNLVGTFAISDASGDLDEMSHDPAQEARS